MDSNRVSNEEECSKSETKEISMSFNLTIPSNNTYYRNFRGHMCLSPQGRAFKVEMAELLKNKCPKILGPVKIDLIFRWRDLRDRDIDNYYKATLDALKNKLFEDDCQIYDLRGRKVCGNKKLKNGFELLVTPYDPTKDMIVFPPSAYLNETGDIVDDECESKEPKKRRRKLSLKTKEKDSDKKQKDELVEKPKEKKKITQPTINEPETIIPTTKTLEALWKSLEDFNA